MKLAEITTYLESIAPVSLQEDYDNTGLLVGNPDLAVEKILISLDCTENLIDRAIKEGFNLIISHHPVIFKGLKKLTDSTYAERIVCKAIKNNIALYAMHTNLDNIKAGVNAKICAKLGLTNTKILCPKTGLLRKLHTYVPFEQVEKVRSALFLAGAGQIGNYSDCSFSAAGIGTFRAGKNTQPFVGKKGIFQQEPEQNLTCIYPFHLENAIIAALIAAHPYEQVAYDCYQLVNKHPEIGAGMIGYLPNPTHALKFLETVQAKMNCEVIKYSKIITDKHIQKIAICGGSGSFLLPEAKQAGADILITSDCKYHDFLDANKQIILADIGHFESEQFTSELIKEKLSEKFCSFANRLLVINERPLDYLVKNTKNNFTTT